MAPLAGRHLFRYMEDPADELATKLGKPPPLRPVVSVRLSHLARSTPLCVALVDSGSERTLAAPGLARVLSVDLTNAIEGSLGIGGRPRHVAFTTIHIELCEDLFKSGQRPISEWDADVGFLTSWEPAWPVLLGQDGFFNEFTITMHRSARALVVEPWEAFDDRFGVQIEQTDTSQPRFQP